MLSSGDLVRVFAPGHGFIDEPGLAVFLRKVIPSQDLPLNHDFWKEESNMSMRDGSYFEILCSGQLFLLHEKQFILVPADDDELVDILLGA